MPLKCTPLKPCPYLLLPRWEFMDTGMCFGALLHICPVCDVFEGTVKIWFSLGTSCELWLCYDSRTDTLLQKILLCGPEEKAQQLHVLSKNVKNHINLSSCYVLHIPLDSIQLLCQIWVVSFCEMQVELENWSSVTQMKQTNVFCFFWQTNNKIFLYKGLL